MEGVIEGKQTQALSLATVYETKRLGIHDISSDQRPNYGKCGQFIRVKSRRPGKDKTFDFDTALTKVWPLSNTSPIAGDSILCAISCRRTSCVKSKYLSAPWRHLRQD
jgi:hypothetical protein